MIIWVLIAIYIAIVISGSLIYRKVFSGILYQNQTYEEVINETAVYPKGRCDQGVEFLYLALALNGEAGEVAEKIKKVARDKNGFANMSDKDRKEIAKELGDVLWYTTTLGREMGYSLEDIMNMNVEKILNRRSTDTLHGSGDNREEA